MSGGRPPKVTGSGVDQGYRDNAVQVCLNKANRLNQRADGYRLLAGLIEKANLAEEEEQKLWSLVAFNE